jgi:PAS domain S-box-containing protein
MINEKPLSDTELTESIRFRILSKTTQDAFWDWDILSDHLWWNEGFQKMFGYGTGEISPSMEAWHSLVHPDDIERVNASLARAIARSDQQWQEEYRFRRADGTFAYVQDRGYTVEFNGKPIRMIGSITDISERIRLEKAREVSESWMRIALEAAELGTWTYDPATGEEIWDERCREIFGLGRHGSYTRALHSMDYVYPDDRATTWNLVQQSLDPQQGGTYYSEHRIVDATSGKIKWVRSRGRAFFSPEGLPIRFAGTIMDITEEKRKERALLHLERRYQAGFDNADLGVAIADLDGSLIQVNAAFSKILGYTPEELRQNTFHRITHADDLEMSVSSLKGLLEGKSTSFGIEKRYLHKDGHIVWASLHCTLLLDDKGRHDCFFLIMQDITAEKNLRDQQQKLLTLVENSIELMSILELDGRNSYINQAGREMLGFDSMEQVLQTPIADLHDPRHYQKVEEEVLTSIMQQGRWSGVMQVRHLKTGEIFPVYNNAIRIDDARTGAPLAVGAVMRDLRPELAAQASLVASEERFRNLVTQAPVAIGLLRGHNMVVESANSLMLELWGKNQEILGQPLMKAMPELEGQGFMERLIGVYTTGVAHHGSEVQARLLRRNQLEDVYFNFVYAPIREAGDEISGVAVIASEVTQQVKAKRELQVSEERFRNLINTAPVATAIYQGPDMVIQLANDAMIRLWGKDESVIGKKLAEALPELEGQPFLGLLQEVYTTGVAYHAAEDRANLVVDGKLQDFYFNFTYKPLQDAKGRTYAILNMAVDVTQQVRARQHLAETEESMREAIELAELGTWTLYPLTGEVECSERVKEWIGVTSRTVTMEEIAMSTHENDRQRTAEITEREFRPDASGKLDIEYRVVNRLTGQERILHTLARAYFDTQGQICMIRGTSQDITRQRLTQQELEKQVALRTEQLQKSNTYLLQTNQELEQYAYVASHDLQEPLRKILIFSGMLENNNNLDARNQEILSKITHSAERMSLLIKDLLDYSRLLKNKIRIAPINLNEVLDKVITDFELVIEEKGAKLIIESLPRIEAVPLQMNQLFYNLLNNALKFSKEGIPPEIEIKSRQLTVQEIEGLQLPDPEQTYFDITFADNGIGFNTEYADRIFELFKRLHTRSNYPGSGIGLALCRRIVQNHQGFLYAESREQEGSTFHVILPLRQMEG